MKYTITYTRTLSLEEVLEAHSKEEAEQLAQIRYGSLANVDFEQADGEIDVVLIERECVGCGYAEALPDIVYCQQCLEERQQEYAQESEIER